MLQKDGEYLLDRCMRNKVLRRVQEKRNILHTIKRKKTNWVGHILGMNCPLNHVIEGKIEVK